MTTEGCYITKDTMQYLDHLLSSEDIPEGKKRQIQEIYDVVISTGIKNLSGIALSPEIALEVRARLMEVL